MSRPRRVWKSPALAALITLLLAAAAALAQDEGPIVIGRQEKLPPFFIGLPHGSLDGTAQYSKDHVSVNVTGNKSDAEEKIYTESISLETSGYVVHPNLLDFRLGGTFGLTQDDFNGTERQGVTQGQLFLWNADANFFRQQPTSLDLYTSRTENFVDQFFGPTFRNTDTVYGALVTVRSQLFPSTFRLNHDEQEQKDFGGVDNYRQEDNTFEWHTESQPTDNQSLTWDYFLDNNHQTALEGFTGTTNSQAATLSHAFLFGDSKENSLGSSFGYWNSTGLFDTERFGLDELLRLQHTPTFETEYEYALTKEHTEGTGQTDNRGRFLFRHHLYRSLVTEGSTTYDYVALEDGGTITDWISNINWNYTKLVPRGTLGATLGLTHDERTTSGNTQPRFVQDPSFSFPTPAPVTIPEPYLLPASVRIFDEQGVLIPTGYTVFPATNGYQILPTDPALLNRRLQLSYTVGPQPDGEIDTNSLSTSLQYNIERGLLAGLTPYGRFLMENESVSGSAASVQPDSIRDYVAGVNYHFWDITLLAEREYYHSQLVPFNATRLSARLDHRFSPETSAGVHANYIDLSYQKLSQTSQTTTVDATLTHNPTRDWSFNGTVTWIMIDDSLGGHSVGLEELVEASWHHRQFEIFGRVRNSSLTSDAQDSSFVLFFVGLRREF